MPSWGIRLACPRIPEAADEYDCKLSPLLHRLRDGVSEGEIRDRIGGEIRGTSKFSPTVLE